MKNFVLALGLTCFCFSCTYTEEQIIIEDDIISDLLGTYSGTFTSDMGDMDPYTLELTKIDDETVHLKTTGSDNYVDLDQQLVRLNDSTIVTQTSQIFGSSSTFIIGMEETSLDLSIDPGGADVLFSGIKE